MKSASIVAGLLGVAFLIGLSLTIFSRRPPPPTEEPITREFTLEGLSTVPSNIVAASIVGSVRVTGDIPLGSTFNVEARQTGTQQFSTVLQNLPATPNQTFSYTKATKGTYYDLKVTLLDVASNVLGSSQPLTVPAPTLYSEFFVTVVLPTLTPIPSPTPTLRAAPSVSAPTPTASPTPTTSVATISGTLIYHGVAPLNTRIVVLQKLGNASVYQVAVDNLLPVDGTAWQWGSASPGKSYSVIAVLKQKRSDGSDTDFATSTPVTVAAPASGVGLTINFNYTLPKPSEPVSVTCTTYNSGPNQNTWNVTVEPPAISGAQSYWLEVGSTDGGYDIINTYGGVVSAPAVFKNSTTYFARYAYAAVAGVSSGSNQYSVFSDTTRLSCGH